VLALDCRSSIDLGCLIFTNSHKEDMV
jgi:hypothetical protein